MTYVRGILVSGIAAVAISFPAAASPTVLGDTHARAAQGSYAQYAQWDRNLYNPRDRSSGIIGLGYKSKKSKTSKKTGTTGQAKGNQ